MDLFQELIHTSPFLYTDIRTLWLSNPFHYLEGEYDMWMMVAGDTTHHNENKINSNTAAKTAATTTTTTTMTYYDLGFVAFTQMPTTIDLLATQTWDLLRQPYLSAAELSSLLSSSPSSSIPKIQVLLHQQVPLFRRILSKRQLFTTKWQSCGVRICSIRTWLWNDIVPMD